MKMVRSEKEGLKSGLCLLCPCSVTPCRVPWCCHSVAQFHVQSEGKRGQQSDSVELISEIVVTGSLCKNLE
mgnify:CR=1 FL=1